MIKISYKEAGELIFFNKPKPKFKVDDIVIVKSSNKKGKINKYMYDYKFNTYNYEVEMGEESDTFPEKDHLPLSALISSPTLCFPFLLIFIILLLYLIICLCF